MGLRTYVRETLNIGFAKNAGFVLSESGIVVYLQSQIEKNILLAHS